MFEEYHRDTGYVSSNQPYSIKLIEKLSNNITQELSDLDNKFEFDSPQKDKLNFTRKFNFFRHACCRPYKKLYGVECELYFSSDYKKNLRVYYTTKHSNFLIRLYYASLIVLVLLAIFTIYFESSLGETVATRCRKFLITFLFFIEFSFAPKAGNTIEKLIQNSFKKAVENKT